MEEITLRRLATQGKQITGEIIRGGAVVAKTVELAWKDNARRISCIPIGTYTVVKRTSNKYGNHFHLINVPSRNMILIHSGNYYSDSLGCIIVGSDHKDIDKDGLVDVVNSKATLSRMFTTFPDRFKIVIKNG
jgi:7-cyano-7-deazaguanine synthase in queuosine biosynthesis